LDFWTFGPAERFFQEESLQEGDIERILSELSYLGLEIILSQKKAGYSNACQKITQVFLEIAREQDCRYVAVQRFLSVDLPQAQVADAVQEIAAVLNATFLDEVPQFSGEDLKKETVSELEEFSTALKQSLIVSSVLEKKVMSLIEQRLLGKLIESRFTERRKIVEDQKKQCDLGLEILKKMLYQVDTKLAGVSQLFAMLKSTWIPHIPSVLHEVISTYSVEAAPRKHIYDLIEEQEVGIGSVTTSTFYKAECLINHYNPDSTCLEDIEHHEDVLRSVVSYAESHVQGLLRDSIDSARFFISQTGHLVLEQREKLDGKREISAFQVTAVLIVVVLCLCLEVLLGTAIYEVAVSISMSASGGFYNSVILARVTSIVMFILNICLLAYAVFREIGRRKAIKNEVDYLSRQASQMKLEIEKLEANKIKINEYIRNSCKPISLSEYYRLNSY